MLVEFTVTNFRSIRESQTLSMVAGSGKELRDTHTVTPKGPATPASTAKPVKLPTLLRSAAIYGPNASGKSNLLEAFHFMHDFVQSSAMDRKAKAPIKTQPFLLDKASKTDPSEFEVTFIMGGVRYQYGFALTRERVMEEWLFAWPKGSSQTWFQRSYDADTDTDIWEYGPSLKGKKADVQKATRPNALFASMAAQYNHEQLSVISDWFYERTFLINRHHFNNPQRLAELTMEDYVEQGDVTPVRNFLRAADLGIDTVDFRRYTLSSADLPDNLPRDLVEQLTSEERTEPLFLHSHSDGEVTERFTWDLESDGTKAMFGLAGPWLNAIKHGMLVIVDELDRSLHPKLVQFLVELIHNPEYNRNNAQLIFTTHDVTTMDELFRRDQMWFVEKNREHATTITPLSDYSPRKGEALQRGYMAGRYGALPELEPELL